MKQHNRITYKKVLNHLATQAKKWDGATLQTGHEAPGVSGLFKLLKNKKLNLKKLSKDIEELGYVPTKFMIAPMKGSIGQYILYYVINYKIEGEENEVR